MEALATGFIRGLGIAGLIVVMLIVGAIKKQRDKKER